MLEKLIIRGFQKQSKLSIEFDPRITTIVGRNNSGKSTIVRALRWLLLNRRPKKGDLTTWGKKKTSVKLVVDGKTILRKKASKLNLYSIDGKKFKAVNRDVPKEIQKHLNISEVNFQRQVDPIFWFTLSAPQLTKELNSIVNLSIIDSSLANITSEVRKASTVIQVTEDRIETAREGRKRLKWVKTADNTLAAIERISHLIESNASTITALASLLSDVSDAKDQLKNADRLILQCQNLTVPLAAAVECERNAKTIQKKIDSLEELLSNIKDARREKCETQRRIEQAEKDLSRAQRKLKSCPLCGQKMMSR